MNRITDCMCCLLTACVTVGGADCAVTVSHLQWLQRELLARKQEEERWRDIPEWKKALILEKEKKKQEEMVSNQLIDITLFIHWRSTATLSLNVCVVVSTECCKKYPNKKLRYHWLSFARRICALYNGVATDSLKTRSSHVCYHYALVF